jgi:hypothetical protein
VQIICLLDGRDCPASRESVEDCLIGTRRPDYLVQRHNLQERRINPLGKHVAAFIMKSANTKASVMLDPISPFTPVPQDKYPGKRVAIP